jgi:NAD(P)-dependent dehydrogenase (short-subunit alcohol dehydrogenase family)
MAVNTRGVVEFTKAVVPSMRQRGAGRIVNIASTTVHSGTPFLMHYVASKGAVIAMTRVMARELGEHGIAVNCIAPGLTMSEAVRHGTDPAIVAGAVRARSFKREQEPDDLVGPLLFLASADSKFVTGQTIVVDGGSIMH